MNRIKMLNKLTAPLSEGNELRVSYLDVAKGVLILSLLLAHFWSAKIRTDYENDYFKYVYGWNCIFTCFYMPAFFIISGYCSNFCKTIKSFFKSLLKSLVLPLLTLSILSEIFYALLISDKSITDSISTVMRQGGTLWFIQALVVGKVICYFLNKIFDKIKYILLATLLLLVIGVVLNQWSICENYFSFHHGLVASFFVAVGICLKKMQREVYDKALKIGLYLYPALCLINFWKSPNITAYLSVYITVIPIFIVLSIFGTLFLLEISKKINKCKFLEYFGKNSLIVYGLHFAPLVFFFKYYYECLNTDTIFGFIAFFLMLYATELTICLIIIKIFSYKPMRWLIGKF